MTSGYRDTQITCPTCDERLEQAPVDDAILDVCSACGGVWVDWFDGDLATMARGAARVGRVDGEVPGATRGTRACPRCLVELRDEPIGESRVSVLRCGECAGVFIPRGDLEAVAALGDPKPAPRELDALSKLALTLQRWLGWKDG